MDKIAPIKINIQKNAYFMRLKVDTNDADFKYHRIEIKEEDIPHIKKMCEAFKRKRYKYNFPSGSAYGFSMEYITKTDVARKYIFSAGEKAFTVFQEYIGKKLFHTIHKVHINDVLLYESNHWSNFRKKN
jgi:hypothetical protein